MIDDQFARDVLSGLTTNPKCLLSKYFYDEKGDELFQKIMQLPEYYLTRCEFEILAQNTHKIIESLSLKRDSFRLIELGAGDGLKSKILLKFLLDNNFDFKYQPVDISNNAIDKLQKDLSSSLPQLQIEGSVGDYFQVLKHTSQSSANRNVVLFLGSNIGNLLDERAADFLSLLSSSLNSGDKVLIGFDLKKDPGLILSAYNDKEGVTRSFNLNLLARINRELEADFDLSQFIHFPLYDPQSAVAKSYIVSLKNQIVNIHELNTAVHFEAMETIHTEVSQKYDLKMIDLLASGSGFEVQENFTDCKSYFSLSLWNKL